MISTDDLKRITVFVGVPEGELAWLAEQSEVRELKPGEVLFEQGDSPDALIMILSGAFQVARESGGQEVTSFTMSGGEVAGMLPFSRMTEQGGTATALVAARVAFFDAAKLPQLRDHAPTVEQQLVNVMVDRSREFTRMNEQREKLTSLGKLSAGLAHELNNPAAAARRAASQLGKNLSAMQNFALEISKLGLAAEQIDALRTYQDKVVGLETPILSALELSDREDELGDWLEDHEVENAWQLAPTLAQAGVMAEHLDELSEITVDCGLERALVWLEATLNVHALVGEIEESTNRISELVKAVKSYTYMDQAPLQELDVHQGLESTLTMLGHRLKDITIHRMYNTSLPKIYAYGSELNQVWTNIIGNAIDAMNGKGQLWLHTMLEGNMMVVEIGDDGPGIPPEIQSRIFEPFFTTKGVGDGTGLGLDISHRIIVKRHRGNIQVESMPGDTCFRIRLPLNLKEIAEASSPSQPSSQAE